MSVQEDSFPAAEKILADVENVLRKDLKLKTFEILPVTLNENKSPVLHLQHCLGLESWCVPHVYCHAYNHIMSIRQNRRKREDHNRIGRLLMGVLMINPDITTLWNMRKDLILSSKLDLHFELHFSAVALSRKPKCADIFAHRKWILKRLLKDSPNDAEIISTELEVCELAADRYSNNYHAWTHRIWCLSQGSQSPPDRISSHLREWAWSESWIASHVSDYSGFQYRQQLLADIIGLSENPHFEENGAALMKKCDRAMEEFVKSAYVKGSQVGGDVAAAVTRPAVRLAVADLLLNTELIDNFPGHESLWCHRRFVLHTFKEALSCAAAGKTNPGGVWGRAGLADHLNSDGVPLEKDKKIDFSSWKEKFALLLGVFEDSFLRHYCESASDPNEIRYLGRHKLWIAKVLKLQLPNDSDLLK